MSIAHANSPGIQEHATFFLALRTTAPGQADIISDVDVALANKCGQIQSIDRLKAVSMLTPVVKLDFNRVMKLPVNVSEAVIQIPCEQR